MSQLITPATFEFFARNLLAGYVIILVRSYFVIGTRPKTADLIIEAVILSLLNQLILFVIKAARLWAGLTASPPPQIALIVEVMGLPTLLGLASGIALTRGPQSSVLRKLLFPGTHPVQRGYDFAFGQRRPPGLVIISYEDGTIVRGYYGPNSLAATDPDRSDIFLERLYSQAESGQWLELDPPRAGLITLKGVRSIEFLEPEKP